MSHMTPSLIIKHTLHLSSGLMALVAECQTCACKVDVHGRQCQQHRTPGSITDGFQPASACDMSLRFWLLVLHQHWQCQLTCWWPRSPPCVQKLLPHHAPSTSAASDDSTGQAPSAQGHCQGPDSPGASFSAWTGSDQQHSACSHVQANFTSQAERTAIKATPCLSC